MITSWCGSGFLWGMSWNNIKLIHVMTKRLESEINFWTAVNISMLISKGTRSEPYSNKVVNSSCSRLVLACRLISSEFAVRVLEIVLIITFLNTSRKGHLRKKWTVSSGRLAHKGQVSWSIKLYRFLWAFSPLKPIRIRAWWTELDEVKQLYNLLGLLNIEDFRRFLKLLKEGTCLTLRSREFQTWSSCQKKDSLT